MPLEKVTFDVSSTGIDDDDISQSIFRKCFPYRSTDASQLPPWPKRIGLFAFGVLQNALAGGLIFGWASIDQSLLSESPEKGGAGLDLQQTTKIFSWATSISMVAALILGAVLDHSGPRLASIISCLTIAAGCLIFALSNHVFGFALGTVLMGFGGPGIGNCIIHLANLFPGNENLAMSSLSGSIALSFSMFAFFDMTWTHNENITFREIFLGYAMLLLVLALGALVLYPDEPYEQRIDDDIFEEVQGSIDMEAEPLIMETQQKQSGADKNVVDLRADEDHHERAMRHRHAGHAPPHVTLIVEQPFNSYLRDKQRMVERTDSFVASSKSLAGGGPVMSLKDMPLWDQLTSASYLRAFLVFLVSTFVTNFYVGTLSTELKDRQNFSAETRHDLSTWFTILMSMGILGSFLVGWLIDRVGLEICTAMTLMFGQLQMLLIIFGSQSETMMIMSFVAYTIFRAFLYPVFIGSLTSRLGFKYFGILLGLGFALSGLVQLLFPILVRWFAGDCHLLIDMDEDAGSSTQCDHGHWQSSEVLQFFILGLMNIVPVLDYRDAAARTIKIQQLLSSNPPKPSYGSSRASDYNDA